MAASGVPSCGLSTWTPCRVAMLHVATSTVMLLKDARLSAGLTEGMCLLSTRTDALILFYDLFDVQHTTSHAAPSRFPQGHRALHVCVAGVENWALRA